MTSTVLPYFVFQSYSFTRWTKNNIPKTYSGNLFEIHLDNFCLFINFKPKLVQYSFELTQHISKIISKASAVGVGCDIKMVCTLLLKSIYLFRFRNLQAAVSRVLQLFLHESWSFCKIGSLINNKVRIDKLSYLCLLCKSLNLLNHTYDSRIPSYSQNSVWKWKHENIWK